MAYLQSLFDLTGHVAVVTGGTGVLCGAMAEALAGAGAEVALVGRDADKAAQRIEAIEAAGGKAGFVEADVFERAAPDTVLSEVLDRWGRCDILVNGAGINSATPFFDIDDAEYDRLMAVNTRSVFRACQVFGRYFIDHGVAASIINVGSMSGVTAISRVFVYSMSKAAVHNLSQNLAREWAPHGIRVNTLVPGFFPAEQNRRILTPDRVESIMRHTPMQRFGEAQELAGATLLLASGAGSFITGLELIVDGGFAAMTI
jgi:NAD(P)-dependent dehydrogenase (short-subunit alcohol dehydrogenase family)